MSNWWYIALALSIFGVTPAYADPCNAPLPDRGEKFSGIVSYIVDGDGLCVGFENGGIEVRLADFYALELREHGGREAKYALTHIAFGKHVSCTAGHRSYDRTVARCNVGGRSLGDLMRNAGIPEGGN